MEVFCTSRFDTPIGSLRIATSQKGLAYVELPHASGRGFEGWRRTHAPNAKVVERRTDARDGQTVVAVLPDEEATLKRFYREPDGGIRLQPANATMSPILVPEVEIRGVVIGVIRRY